MVKTDVTSIYIAGQGIIDLDKYSIGKEVHANPNAHYGTGVWEGMRCNDGNIFRLEDHIDRLINSARITGTPLPWSNAEISKEEIKKGILEVAKKHIKIKGEGGFYIRPSIYFEDGEMGLDQSSNPTGFKVVTWPWEHYHKENVVDSGIEVLVSQYTKECGHPEFMKAKTPPNYGLSVMEKIEAKKKGYLDALFLNREGYVAEATGANIFFVLNGGVYTPPQEMKEILNGITRDSVIQLLAYDGCVQVEEAMIPEKFMYECEEAFLTGTASRVVPVVSVTDREKEKHVIGKDISSDGKPGEITRLAYDLYVKATRGDIPEFRHWLTKVEV